MSQFALYIKGSKGYKPKKYDQLILTSYDEICNEINKAYRNKDQLKKSEIEPVEIHLNHKKMKTIIIYNKEEWNFLYNYNVINECISNTNKLKIDYKIIDSSYKVDENEKNENYKKILSYIMEQIPENFYIKILFKFFKVKEDIAKLFQRFFLNELKNTSLDELINKKQGVKESLILKNNQSHIFDENDYSLKTEEFLKLYKDQILRFKNSLNEILEDYDDKNNDNDIKTFKTYNNIIKNDIDFIEINKSDIIHEKNNIYFTILNKGIKENNYLDENKYFKKLKTEEYYLGIEEIKDRLKREVLSL